MSKSEPVTFLIDAVAVARLTRLVTQDTFPPVRRLRERIWCRYPIEGTLLDAKMGWTLTPVEEPSVARRAGVTVKVACGPDKTAGYVAEPHPIGELFSCVWCSSFWVALGVIAVRRFFPRLWDPAAKAFAMSEVAGILGSKM